jgi:NADH:ubiquinone reductase (H+-translocating)
MTVRPLPGPRRRPPGPPRAGSVTGGMLLGLVAWLVLPLTLLPLRAAPVPSWSLPRAGALFPGLLLCLAVGGAVGPLLQSVAGRLAAHRLAARQAPGRRVVIVGGGFGGVAVARRLEQLLPRAPDLDVTLVSQSNYLLFTPMLSEVAAGSIQAGSIGAPLRAICPRTRFIRAQVIGLDPASRAVLLRTPAGDEALHYDHLVLALGASADVNGLPGVAERALPLKNLEDASRLRGHVLAQLEHADLTADPEERCRLLTFVVVGGGFAGVEAIAGIASLVRSVLGYYPRIRRSEPRFVLVHSRDRILPELRAKVSRYAHEKLEARGVEFRLNARVIAAAEGAVALGTGELLPASTLVWTTGNRPNPLLAELPLTQDGGAVLVDPTLRVAGTDGIWALGDCARVPDLERGGTPCPPTAQHALRQGKVLAENLVATTAGARPKAFRFRAKGFLVGLGHQTAAAQLRHLRVGGLPALLIWRALYLSKLPGAEKRLRVLVDWALGFLFPRDTVLAGGTPTRARRPARVSRRGGHERVA